MTSAVESNPSAETACHREQTEIVDVRAWCLDCYDRREPWVLRALGELGVEFRPSVIEAVDACRSCKAELQVGLHAIVVTIPMPKPAPAR